MFANHQRPDRLRMLNDRNEEFQIPRGAGLSYAPASFGKDRLIRDMCSFDRILEFDESSKIVVVEAGISLKKLLMWSFSKQLFLPVLPGQPEITVGGCVAANVHGKNPYKDGTFMEQVEWIELSHPTLGTKIISRSNEKKIFKALKKVQKAKKADEDDNESKFSDAERRLREELAAFKLK